MQQWNLNLDINFPKTSIDSKLGLLSVGFVHCWTIAPSSSKIYKKRLGFLNISLGCFSNSFSIHRELGIKSYDFWSSLNFIFSQIVRIVCQVLYVCRRERWTQFIIQLSVFKKKKYSYFYNNFVSVQVPEIMFPNLNQSNNCKIFLGWHKPRLRKFEINHTCSSTPYFARILPNM